MPVQPGKVGSPGPGCCLRDAAPRGLREVGVAGAQDRPGRLSGWSSSERASSVRARSRRQRAGGVRLVIQKMSFGVTVKVRGLLSVIQTVPAVQPQGFFLPSSEK